MKLMMKKTLQGIGALGLVSCLTGASGCWSCFVRGTRIVTPRGFRRIEDLAVGDEVYSLDVESRRPVVRRVARLLRAEATETFHIAAGELHIAGVTSEHPFYDAERKAWTPAGEIQKGTQLVAWLGTSDVRDLEVTTHHRAPSKGKVEVFNLTIDGPEHNYFAEGLLVHNKDVPLGNSDPTGQPCITDEECSSGANLICAPTFDGMCGPVDKRCTPAICGEGPLRTICGCDGKPHADDNCPSGMDVEIDKRPGACAPPAGMYNCGDGTCVSESQYCVEGFTEIKCVDLPLNCTGAEASCACLEAAAMSACGCTVSDGGIRVAECKP
jgi:hypothetical protein